MSIASIYQTQGSNMVVRFSHKYAINSHSNSILFFSYRREEETEVLVIQTEVLGSQA